MPEGLDQARDAFASEIAPASRPRDQAGRFVVTSRAPEPIFQPRAIEGDERGDTRDAGPDPRFVEHERRIADGRSEEGNEDGRQAGRKVGQNRQPVSDDAAQRRSAAADDGHEPTEDEPERLRPGESDEQDQDAEGQDKRPGADGTSEQDAEGPRFEVNLDGEPVEVSLQELTRSYVREKDFQARVARVSEVAQAADQERAQATQARDAFIHALRIQEQEFQALLPQEPNWDELFKHNPAQAHELQKNFQTIYGKLNQLRQHRAQAEQQAAQEYEQRTAAYAKNEFSAFITESRIQNEGELKKEIDSMRQTARNAGFSEAEIATVYDRRMLKILRKASKYDRMMANKPIPVQPGKGRTLQPGASRGIGNTNRHGFDSDMRKLEQSGRIDDAEAVFKRMLG
jgi:hypothetical protein